MKLARLGDGPEIFHTLQGEGVSVGLPAVFVRTSRCNLHCVWCDSEFTWNFHGTPWIHQRDSAGMPAKVGKSEVTCEITPREVAEAVLRFQCPRLILTGGEPLLQQADLLAVIGLVRESLPTCAVEVETNGTRPPSDAFLNAVDQFNVSPKLANSGMAENLRLIPSVLSTFAASDKAWFKFVVANQGDLDEVLWLARRHEIRRDRILLMPQGRTVAEMDQVAGWLAEACRGLGLRFCDRLHVRLWGDRRGV